MKGSQSRQGAGGAESQRAGRKDPSQVVVFSALRGESIGLDRKSYPMFLGFLPPSEILKVAEVPSFGRDKHHYEISGQLKRPPIDDWQRPMDEEKWREIARIYSTDHGQVMANPVILANSNDRVARQGVQFQQQTVRRPDGAQIPVPGLWDFEIAFSAAAKALWILDGQHRLKGMSESSQKDTPVPFVLLWDPEVYLPDKLAGMFTLVTSKAEPMQPVHAAWMHFSFKMKPYHEVGHHTAMDTVIHLCSEPSFDGGDANPFFDSITFNPYSPAKPFGAFKFDAPRFAEIVFEDYFNRNPAEPLRAAELAAEVCRAVLAAKRLDRYAFGAGEESSRLFSDSRDIASELLAEGFLHGLLKHLATQRPKVDERSGHRVVRTAEQWLTWFKEPNRRLDAADLRLRFTQGKDLGGNYSAPSRGVARECFWALFDGRLKEWTLSELLGGSGMKLKVITMRQTKAGRPSFKDVSAVERVVENSMEIEVDRTDPGGPPRRFLKIEPASPNCHVYEVRDLGTGQALRKAITKPAGHDLEPYPRGQGIEVSCIAFSSGTVRKVALRVLKT